MQAFKLVGDVLEATKSPRKRASLLGFYPTLEAAWGLLLQSTIKGIDNIGFRGCVDISQPERGFYGKLDSDCCIDYYRRGMYL